MIGSLAGVLVHKSPPALLIEVGGVGYELEAPMSTFYGLPPVGQPVRLLTHLVVREDAHVLYGFGTSAERQLFRSLLKVSGVGPRIALAILSGSTAEAFAVCVQAGDSAALTRIPGVGRKIAERLIVEMRDRLAAAAADGHAATAATPRGRRRRGLQCVDRARLQARRGDAPAQERHCRRQHRRSDPQRAAGRGARMSAPGARGTVG